MSFSNQISPTTFDPYDKFSSCDTLILSFCSYLRCSPEVLAQQREENSAFHQVSTMLKYLIPKKAPKMAMFGPGLESSTSGIVRKMLYEDQSHFTRVAMFPGQFDGKWLQNTVIILRAVLLHSAHGF